MAKTGPRMSRRASRERAEQGIVLRSRGKTWAEVAAELGYSGRAAAERAVTYELRRTSPESPSEARRFLLSSARDTARQWHERFEAAAAAGDIEAMVAAHNGLFKDREQQARLTGANAPVDMRVGISAEVFAQRAAELLETVGPGPLYELAGVRQPAPPAPVVVEADEEPPWSNIGPQPPWISGTPALVHADPGISPPQPRL